MSRELSGSRRGRDGSTPDSDPDRETVTDQRPTNPANTPPHNRITFTQPDKPLNMNDRLHWAVKARRSRAWRAAAGNAAVTQLGNTPSTRRRPPSFVRITFPVTQNRRRDPHNMAPTEKAIVDGLVDAEIWADDTDDYVIVLDARFAKGAEHVTVELSPRAEEA